MSEQRTAIDSFVIRFVRTAGVEPGLQIRGSIRHLQTDEERAFSHWQEIEHFIRRFIPLEPDLPEDPESATENPGPPGQP